MTSLLIVTGVDFSNNNNRDTYLTFNFIELARVKGTQPGVVKLALLTLPNKSCFNSWGGGQAIEPLEFKYFLKIYDITKHSNESMTRGGIILHGHLYFRNWLLLVTRSGLHTLALSQSNC